MVDDGKPLENLRYILIDNVAEINPQNGEDFRGYNHFKKSAIRIYPKGRKLMSYGRIEDVSNFEAILIHECSHFIADLNYDFYSDWRKKFQWNFLQQHKKVENGGELFQETEFPERCVSEYAKTSSIP